MHRIVRLACGLGSIAIVAMTAAEPVVGPAWDLVTDSAMASYTVDIAAGTVAARDHRPTTDLVSPDGTRVLSLGRAADADAKQWPQLFVAASDGSDVRQLTKDVHKARDLHWMPDGRNVIYVHGKGKGTQVYRIDVTSRRPGDQRISEGSRQSWMPRVSSTGRIAYVELLRREGKAMVSRIMVVEPSGDRRTLVSELDVTDMAWSPDGLRLAYSTHGTLVLHDFSTGRKQVFKYIDHDVRLYAHHASRMAWRPDGTAIALRINFSGGRSAGFGEAMPVIFGDHEVFVLDRKSGELDWTKGPKDATTIRWVERTAE